MYDFRRITLFYSILRYDLATFLFENSCFGFLETLFVKEIIELSTEEKDTWKWVDTVVF